MSTTTAGWTLRSESSPAESPSISLRRQCRAIARRRALLAAVSSLIPLPGIDLAADLAVMSHLVGHINRHYGLSEAQISLLAGPRQRLLNQLLAGAGNTLAARLSTPALLGRLVRLIGWRLGAMEAVRLVPIAGQIVAAGIGYWTITFVASRHISRCENLLAELERKTAR